MVHCWQSMAERCPGKAGAHPKQADAAAFALEISDRGEAEAEEQDAEGAGVVQEADHTGALGTHLCQAETTGIRSQADSKLGLRCSHRPPGSSEDTTSTALITTSHTDLTDTRQTTTDQELICCSTVGHQKFHVIHLCSSSSKLDHVQLRFKNMTRGPASAAGSSEARRRHSWSPGAGCRQAGSTSANAA